MRGESKVKQLVDRQAVRVVLVGILNTLVGSAIMFGFYNLAGVPYWIATASNYILVSILSFFLNKSFTFGHKGGTFRSGLRFAVNIGVCYLLAYGIAKPCAAALLTGRSLRMQENGAMLAGMCLFTVLNYLGQRWFVFGQK